MKRKGAGYGADIHSNQKMCVDGLSSAADGLNEQGWQSGTSSERHGKDTVSQKETIWRKQRKCLPQNRNTARRKAHFIRYLIWVSKNI